MADDTQSGWSFPTANGHLGPRSIAMLIETVAGHHVNEPAVAQWAIHNGEVTALTPDSDAAEAGYGMSPTQAVATLNALGGQYGIEAELHFASIGDLESECHHGRILLIEIGDSHPGAQTRFAVLSAFDPAANAVTVNAPGATGPATETIPLSALEQAWSASNGAMIVTSHGSQVGPALLPVLIEPHLVSVA